MVGVNHTGRGGGPQGSIRVNKNAGEAAEVWKPCACAVARRPSKKLLGLMLIRLVNNKLKKAEAVGDRGTCHALCNVLTNS